MPARGAHSLDAACFSSVYIYCDGNRTFEAQRTDASYMARSLCGDAVRFSAFETRLANKPSLQLRDGDASLASFGRAGGNIMDRQTDHRFRREVSENRRKSIAPLDARCN